MKRIPTSHQTIAAKQRNCTYRPSGAIAQHILDATIYDESLTEQIIPQDGRYLVVSAKFAHRYYVVTNQAGAWQCSSRDEAVAAKCIAQVQAYVVALC